MEDIHYRDLRYWYDNNYVSGHKCSSKQMFLLEVSEKTESGPVSETEKTTNWESPKISIHAISRTVGFSDMQFEGMTNGI